MSPPPARRSAAQTANQMLRTLAASPENTIVRDILKRIKQDGYACTAVVPDPSRRTRGWTYTVGLCLSHLPELVIAHMPSTQAAGYLGHVVAIQRTDVTLKDGDLVTMHDGSVWKISAHDPRRTLYGLRQTMRLFGSAHKVRAWRLMPPPRLQWPPGSGWGAQECTCPAEDNGSGHGVHHPAAPARVPGIVVEQGAVHAEADGVRVR